MSDDTQDVEIQELRDDVDDLYKYKNVTEEVLSNCVTSCEYSEGAYTDLSKRVETLEVLLLRILGEEVEGEIPIE